MSMKDIIGDYQAFFSLQLRRLIDVHIDISGCELSHLASVVRMPVIGTKWLNANLPFHSKSGGVSLIRILCLNGRKIVFSKANGFSRPAG